MSLNTWVLKCSKLLGVEGGYRVSGGPHRTENWVLGKGQGCSPAPCLREVTPTPFSLHSERCHEGEGKS